MTTKRSLRVDLCRRTLGRHERVRTAEVPLLFDSVATVGRDGEVNVDEDALLAALAHVPGFLPADPSTVLLLVEDTAVRNPKRFRAWGKYFNAFSVFLYPSERAPQSEVRS